MDLHPRIAREQGRWGIVPLLESQPRRYAVCGTCGRAIEGALVETLAGNRERSESRFEPYRGKWRDGEHIYFHADPERCL